MRSLREMTIPFAALTAPHVATAQPVGADGWHGWGWGWGHMVFGSLMMLLVFAAVLFAVLAAVRGLGGSSQRGESSPSGKALAILEERFARGEIDREEFEERKRVLTH